jgi:hypothetical protein
MPHKADRFAISPVLCTSSMILAYPLPRLSPTPPLLCAWILLPDRRRQNLSEAYVRDLMPSLHTLHSPNREMSVAASFVLWLSAPYIFSCQLLSSTEWIRRLWSQTAGNTAAMLRSLSRLQTAPLFPSNPAPPPAPTANYSDFQSVSVLIPLNH